MNILIALVLTLLSLAPYSTYANSGVQLYADAPPATITIPEARLLFSKETFYRARHIYVLPYTYNEQNKFVVNVLGISPTRFKEIATTSSKFIPVQSYQGMRSRLIKCTSCVGLSKQYLMRYDVSRHRVIAVRIIY